MKQDFILIYQDCALRKKLTTNIHQDLLFLEYDVIATMYPFF